MGRRRYDAGRSLCARMHSGPVKSLIFARRARCYLDVVQTDGPAPHGVECGTQGVCVMTFSSLPQIVARISPAFLTIAMFGLVVGFASVGVVA